MTTTTTYTNWEEVWGDVGYLDMWDSVTTDTGLVGGGFIKKKRKKRHDETDDYLIRLLLLMEK